MLLVAEAAAHCDSTCLLISVSSTLLTFHLGPILIKVGFVP